MEKIPNNLRHTVRPPYTMAVEDSNHLGQLLSDPFEDNFAPEFVLHPAELEFCGSYVGVRC